MVVPSFCGSKAREAREEMNSGECVNDNRLTGSDEGEGIAKYGWYRSMRRRISSSACHLVNPWSLQTDNASSLGKVR